MLPPSVEDSTRQDLRDLRQAVERWKDTAPVFDWNGLFERAQHINRNNLERAASQDELGKAPSASQDPYETVAVQRIKKAKNMVMNAYVGIAVLGMVLLTPKLVQTIATGGSEDKPLSPSQQQLADIVETVQQVMGAAVGIGVMLMMVMAGWMFVTSGGDVSGYSSASGKSPQAGSAKGGPINLVVPAPITYGATAELGSEGQLVAKVWRNLPHVNADATDMDLTREPLGEWAFSTGEDTQAVELWEEILTELDVAEETAAAPYRRMLEEHGLVGEARIESEERLRLRVEEARERRHVNVAVVEGFNHHARQRAQLVAELRGERLGSAAA